MPPAWKDGALEPGAVVIPAETGPVASARSGSPSALWLVGERVAKAAATGLFFVVLARYLGPADYGRFATALSLGVVSKTVVGLGLLGIIQRELAQRPGDASVIIGTFAGLAAAAVAVTGLALTGLAWWTIHDAPTLRMALVLAWIGFPQIAMGAETWFLARMEPRPLIFARNGLWLVFLLVRVGLMLGDAPLPWFAWVAVIDWVAMYAAVWALYRRRNPAAGRPRWSGRLARTWLAEGWPLTATVVLGLGAERYLGLILQRLDSLAGAGIFGLALKCVEPWWEVAAIAAIAFLPRFALAARRSAAECGRYLERYLDVSMALSVGVALVVTVLAPFVISPVLGDKYREAVLPFVLLCWAAPALFAAQGRLQYLTARGRLLVELPCCVVSFILQLGLSLWWIPHHGSAGAAAALLVSAWLSVFLVPWLVPKAREAARAQWRSLGFLLRLPAIAAELRDAARSALRGVWS